MKIQPKHCAIVAGSLAGFLSLGWQAQAQNKPAATGSPAKEAAAQPASKTAPPAGVKPAPQAAPTGAPKVMVTPAQQKALVSSVKSLQEAVKLSRARKWPQAHAAYTSLIKSNPELGIAYADRALTLLAMKRYGEAVADCNKAIALRKDTFEVYNRRAVAYMQMKKYDLALADFTKVINLNPSSAAAYRDRAVCYLRKGDKKNAKRDIDMAKKAIGGKLTASSQQQKTSFLAVKGGNLVDLSSVQTEKFDEMMQKDPAHKPMFMLQRATVNMLQAKPQKALEDVDQVLKLSDADLIKGGCPPRDKVQQLRMTALHKLGRHGDAIAESNSLLKLHPDDEQARLILAMSYYETGKYKEAMDEAGKIKKNPKLAQAAKIIRDKAGKGAKARPKK